VRGARGGGAGAEDVGERVEGGEILRFEVRSGLVIFHDDKPGSYANMDGPHGGLVFRGDASSFSDATRAYAWAFDWSGELADGDQFFFSTDAHEALGEVKDGEIVAMPGKRRTVAEMPPPSKLISLRRPTTPGAPSASARCLFVNPCIPYNQWACYRAGVMNEASFSSHGAAYVSAALKAEGHSCWMVDLRTLSDWGHVRDTLAAQEYDVAFVGFLSIDVFHAAAVVRLLKELHPDRPVVVGGLHVSIAKERVFPRPDIVSYYCWDNHDLLPDSFKQFLAFKGEGRYIPERYPLADYVILDDGEIAAQQLVAELAAGRRPENRTWEGGAVPMEVARHMDRDLFNLKVEAYSPILPFQPTPMVTVTWARGCGYRCTYCNLSSQLSNTNVRTKPVELVEEELNDLHRRFNGKVGSVMIHDDLTFHIKHIAAWCELILRNHGPIPLWMQTRAPMIVAWYEHRRDLWELLCRAGLTYVSVGYESGSNRMLEHMKKDCTVEENIECGRILDEYGINSFGNFLWGCPTETHEEAEDTVRLVEKIRPGFLSGSVYCSYPGTKMDLENRREGYLVPGSVYTRSHLPWQVTVKGIDYPHVFDCLSRAGRYSNYLRMPKLLSPERQKALAATARGLPIHVAGQTQ
jgi:radical SAM superfamily enzyme YgiQ (UPF0313 family)